MSDFSNIVGLNTSSLLPAPLHVAYRDKNEDDELEKAYIEVCEMWSAILEFPFLLVLNDRSQGRRFLKCVI